MQAPVRILVLSSSHRGTSRSELLAIRCKQVLEANGADVQIVSLKEHGFPPLLVESVAESDAYKALYPLVLEADGIVLASPVYNWSLSGALKQFIEHIGSTDSTMKAALFDKVITFVCAAGLPHGYMSFGSTALSLMLDFRCIINPYQVFVHDRGWNGDRLTDESEEQIQRVMGVTLELTSLLRGRTYQSEWSV